MQPKASPHNSSLAARRTRLAEAAATVAYRPSLKNSQTEELVLSGAPTASVGTQASEIQPEIPPGWIKGQLLNVRNTGGEYVVTLLGEEFDPRHPERALKFQNPARCQDFVSKWYAREHCDPRAF